MRIQYDDYNNSINFYCANCHRDVADELEYRYCPYCGHKYEPARVNALRQKMAKMINEEMYK